jgi:plastocyanin
MSSRVVLAVVLAIVACVAFAADLTVRVTTEDGKALTDAVLFLPGVALPAGSAVQKRAAIAQRNRVFDPFVTVIERGSAIDFPNEDTMLHHVYSFSPAKRFEIKLYKGTPPAPVVFDTPGIVVLGCNLHDWMLAYIVVLDTRIHAKSGSDGSARLTGVPAGSHDLMAWYPGMREPVRLQQVELRADESKRIEAKLNVPLKTRPRAPPLDPMRY